MGRFSCASVASGKESPKLMEVIARWNQCIHIRHINKTPGSLYIPMATKERVVNAIITSWLDYCISLLYCTSVNNIARLQRIHNSAARLILRRPRSDSAMLLLCILHWLPVPQRVEFKLLVFTYNLLCTYKPARALRSAKNNLLYIAIVRTHVKAGDNSIVVAAAAATLLNALPNNIKTSACLATFKARLKTHFF